MRFPFVAFERRVPAPQLTRARAVPSAALLAAPPRPRAGGATDMRRSRSPSRSRSSASSSSSSSSRSRSRDLARRVAALSDDALLARRRRLLERIDVEREIARRAETTLKRAREAESDEEEGQIPGDARDAPPPAKVARAYVPPHARDRDGSRAKSDGRDDWRRADAKQSGRADAGDWRRRDAAKAATPRLPAPGERGFGVGRGRAVEDGGVGRETTSLGDGPGTEAARRPPVESRGRFEDASAAPSAKTIPAPRPVPVPAPPPVKPRSPPRAVVAAAPDPAPPPKDPSPPPAADDEDDDEDDDIEAIRAAAARAAATRPAAPEVVEIEVEIPDKPSAVAPRRSSRRSTSPERDADPPRRSSRRSVSAERRSTNPPPSADGLTKVEGDPAKLTVVVLKKLLTERELSTAGLKAALVERLKSALADEGS